MASYTQEKWIELASKKHSGKYTYQDTVYKGAKHKVEVTCPLHGNFWLAAGSHLHRSGCPTCSRETATAKQLMGVDEFIRRALVAHGEKYNYSNVVYKSCKHKVEIICEKHGAFLQTADDHLAGYGCDKCARDAGGLARRKTQDQFIEKSIATHNERYSYDRVAYVANNTPVEIGCSVHGYFKQAPSKHQAGQGCPKCMKNGYSTSKPGHLYILTSENTTKVGITNRKVQTRVDEINKRGAPDLKINSTFYFTDGAIPQRLESHVHEYLRSNYQQVAEVFDGSTECFYDVDLQALTSFVTSIAVPEANNSPTA